MHLPPSFIDGARSSWGDVPDCRRSHRKDHLPHSGQVEWLVMVYFLWKL